MVIAGSQHQNYDQIAMVVKVNEGLVKVSEGKSST